MDREDRSWQARLANLVLSTLADLFAWDPLLYQFWPRRWAIGQTFAILVADVSRDGSACAGVAVTAAVSGHRSPRELPR